MPVIPSDYIGEGSGKIAIKFNNGTGVVTGYIEKQTGTRRYDVSDGSSTFSVTLARTVADVEAMVPGMATIECFPFLNGEVSTTPEHIHKIEQFVCYTVEGHRYGWRFAVAFEIGIGHGADQDGEANIAQLP